MCDSQSEDGDEQIWMVVGDTTSGDTTIEEEALDFSEAQWELLAEGKVKKCILVKRYGTVDKLSKRHERLGIMINLGS